MFSLGGGFGGFGDGHGALGAELFLFHFHARGRRRDLQALGQLMLAILPLLDADLGHDDQFAGGAVVGQHVLAGIVAGAQQQADDHQQDGHQAGPQDPLARGAAEGRLGLGGEAGGSGGTRRGAGVLADRERHG